MYLSNNPRFLKFSRHYLVQISLVVNAKRCALKWVLFIPPSGMKLQCQLGQITKSRKTMLSKVSEIQTNHPQPAICFGKDQCRRIVNNGWLQLSPKGRWMCLLWDFWLTFTIVCNRRYTATTGTLPWQQVSIPGGISFRWQMDKSNGGEIDAGSHVHTHTEEQCGFLHVFWFYRYWQPTHVMVPHDSFSTCHFWLAWVIRVVWDNSKSSIPNTG